MCRRPPFAETPTDIIHNRHLRCLHTITAGAPFYAFEFPWIRGEGSAAAPDGTKNVTVHLQTHELHMLVRLDEDETVVMNDNPGPHDYWKWSVDKPSDADSSNDGSSDEDC